MSRLLLLSLLLVPAALAQDGAVPSVETDQSEYAYGETIELRYTIANESDEAFTLTSPSGSCTAGFTFGSLVSPGESGGCTADEVSIEFPPNSSRTWVWQIVPNEHGVPEASGEQSITAYFGVYIEPRFVAETSISAPRYLGGRLSLRLSDGFTLDDVQDVMEMLNAIVVEGGGLYYTWEIEGVTLADAVDRYADDERFAAFSISRFVDYSAIILTDDEADAVPLTFVLTTAHPNPFVASTSFTLTAPASGPARIEVFDLLGRRVAVLHDGPLTAGAEHHFTFHAASLPSGLYVVRATGDGFTETRRVTLAR